MKDIFWTDLLKFFFEFKSKEKIPFNVESIIWYNSSLKIEGKTLFYKELFDNNIIFIKDILDEENKCKTYDELKNQLNCNLNFLKYFSLISMIKSKNVTNITNAEYRSHLINTILNSKSSSKEIYNKFSPLEDLEVDSIKGISKWKSDMETDINFSDVFCNLCFVTNDSKLKKFQYKLLHRALPTNTFLVKIGIKNSDLCNFCKNTSDSILHYIWLCPVVKLFWNRIKTWLEEFFNIPIELNMGNAVFITNVNECPFVIIEFVMLFTTYYIHCCKWSNNLPTIEVLKAKLKSRENMERSNSIYKDKLKDHEDRWLKLL
jgi:hypothetical protein